MDTITVLVKKLKNKRMLVEFCLTPEGCRGVSAVYPLDSASYHNSNQQSTLLSAEDSVCCDDQIKNLTETALSTTGFIPGQSQFVDIAGKAVKIVQNFIQSHFGTTFEVIIAKKQLTMKTYYKGPNLCKFESNGWHFAIYETPGKEIRGYLTELFSVPENARDLQWSTNTMNLLVEYVPTLQMFQLGGIPLRNMRLDVMRRILDDGADDMIHGNNAIFPLMDTLYFVIEEINLWLDENPIIENRMNHQQLQNAEGEEVPGIPGDEGVNALVINRLLNITAVDILVEAPPAEELPVRHVAVNMPRITDDDRRNEAATVIPRNPSSGAIVVDTPVEASLVRQSDWCSQSEMIVYLCIIVFVALWVAYQVVCRFRNNPRR
ncbi:hypothetical protein WR25_19569 [Diploscapter pachys]|uniref:Ground-like domain-containing protein n=1 Tax=Diploscapter pachys TaxID=2018661 RepID=A0A2A2JEF0_9BILA|nr:hypothetical protein WR25_19569 [Diploscapter pachys]